MVGFTQSWKKKVDTKIPQNMPQKYGSREKSRDKAEKNKSVDQNFRTIFREHVFFGQTWPSFKKKYLSYWDESHEISVNLMQKPSHFATLGGSDPLIPWASD